MGGQHATFPPSAMHRLIACPASHKEELVAPPQPPSEFAIKGTLLHEVVARMLQSHDLSPADELEPADKSYVLDAYDYVTDIAAGRPFLVEHRGSLKPWGIPQVWGTADIVIHFDDQLVVIDHKFGQGVQVYAFENYQFMTYAAISAGYPPKYKKFVVHCCQPPLGHYDSWEFGVYELEEFVFQKMLPAIEEATSDSPSYHPSPEACRFCRGSMTCKARMRYMERKAQNVFEAAPAILKNLHNVQLDRLVAFFDSTEEIVKYRSEVAKYLLDQGLKGEQVPGKRVVAGRNRREWTDKEVIVNLLGGDAYESKLISPAKAEKMFRHLKKEIQPYIRTIPGKPILVDADDKRPDYLETSNVFDEV